MKRQQLYLLGTNTVIQAARRLSLICVMRCHKKSLKGKGQNLISSNSVAWAYLLSCWLSNPNVHRLLIPGQLPTNALNKRLSPILLWAESPQRNPINIVNTILKTVCVFGGRWGAHYYLASPKYKNITNNLQNRLPFLVLNC